MSFFFRNPNRNLAALTNLGLKKTITVHHLHVKGTMWYSVKHVYYENTNTFCVLKGDSTIVLSSQIVRQHKNFERDISWELRHNRKNKGGK